MRGLFIGRFQPFHKGHLTIVKRMAEECDVVILGVGSAQHEHTVTDPLSGSERIVMIGDTLKKEGITNFEIYPVPDINCYPAWPHYVRSILPPFDRIYTNSKVVKRLFRDIRVKVVDVEPVNRDQWRGEEIRRRIRESEEWKELVPTYVAEYLEKIDMKDRIKPIFGMSEETEKEVAHLLTKKDLTIATAESCSGGLVAHRLTNVPGSSMYFITGMITYSNQSKIELLEVDEEDLIEYGAVSPVIAEQMAQGVRKKTGSDIGLSTTGIAGPGGGTKEKKVGTVYIGISIGDEVKVEKFHFNGDRWQVKEQTSESALRCLREILEATH